MPYHGEEQLDTLRQLQEDIIACRRCPRLVEHREQVAREKRPRSREETYWGRPVPGFGDHQARLLILGLAPAAHGGNRTGRVFTGDPSAQFLFSCLYEAGFASQPTSEHRDDGLALRDAYITAVVKCAPPQNHPTAEEAHNCRPYLVGELNALPRVKAILALGSIAFQGYVQGLEALTGERHRLAFGHGVHYEMSQGPPHLFGSYHPSPHNTYTGRLKREQFIALLGRVRAALEEVSYGALSSTPP